MATTRQAKKPVAKKVTAKTTSSKIETTVNEAIEDVKQEATSRLETLKENFAKTQGSAQKAWFVGLGAFDRSTDEIKARFEQMNGDRQKLVNELAARGEKVQDEAGVALKQRRADIEEQIESAKDRMSDLTSGFDVSARLQDVSDKLQSLAKDLKKSA